MPTSTTVPPTRGVAAAANESKGLLQQASTTSKSGASEYGASSTRQPQLELPTKLEKGGGWRRLGKKVDEGEVFVHHDDTNTEQEDSSKPKWSDFEVPHELKTSECIKLALALVLTGTVAFSFIFERWPILDSIYFSIVLLTTVGYGDECPSTPGGKLFASVFALTGVVLLGLVLGELGSRAVEAEMKYMQKVKDRSANVIEAAFTHEYKEGDNEKEHAETDSSADIESGTVREPIGIGPFQSMQVFRPTMRVIGHYLPVIVPLFGSVFLAGRFLAQWEWYDMIYFCVVTATTIGFGDLSATNDGMKIFAIFFIPIAVALMGYIIGEIAEKILSKRREQNEKKLWSVNLTAEDIEALDYDGDGEVSELEYFKFMLIAMQKVDIELCDKIHRQYVLLDTNKDGSLSVDDLKDMAKQRIYRRVSLSGST